METVGQRQIRPWTRHIRFHSHQALVLDDRDVVDLEETCLVLLGRRQVEEWEVVSRAVLDREVETVGRLSESFSGPSRPCHSPKPTLLQW